MSDHYQTLGVAKTATPDEIKKSYRKLASQHHPDKGGDTATFQKIQAAYETLSDPNKKQQYDTPMPPGFQQFNGMPPGFEDIFNNMMGGRASPFGDIFGGQHKRQPQPPMFRTTIEISLEQAMSKGSVTSQWQPLTLQGAGLYHIAMGAVLGIAAYGRTKEKVAGAA
jgi:DnaJ-class molecular chaperone